MIQNSESGKDVKSKACSHTWPGLVYRTQGRFVQEGKANIPWASLSNPHPGLEYGDSDLGPTPYCVNLEMLVNLSRLQFVICKLGIKSTTVEAIFIQYNPVCLAIC